MLPMPGCCWLCQLPLRLQQQGICGFCQRNLLRRSARCPQCGLAAENARQPCGRCLRQPPPWQALIAAGNYQPPLSALLIRFKFLRLTALSVMLARLILLSWLDARRQRLLVRPDILLAVPLPKTRAWRRGFNQTDLLARPLARWVGCRYQPTGLRSVRAVKHQHRLPARARRRNLLGAFRVEIAVRGCHIAVIDDVVTTGSTAAEISRLLIHAGAASVQIWCLCRTL
ncbi:Phosphoribosyltransferase [Paramixta manurensis]|uniref:Phosphoribosyltransferase n=1 Tax=Paramixta manurensis TaxID=2740817 RepID=A0A6M8U9V6_9GAMM|nr:Phosphoribosyltransferase [Erwiniaceae bacterium PD-1]